MRLGQDVLARLPLALRHEWLLPDGLGGWSAGTAAGAVARPEHALLVPAGSPRVPVLLRIDERAVVDGATFELASRAEAGPPPERPAGPGPARIPVRGVGHQWIESFTLDPWPVWRYRLGSALLEKSVFPVYEHPGIAVTWRLLEGDSLRLTVSPLVTARAWAADGTLHAGDEGAETEAADVPLLQTMPGRVRLDLEAGIPTLTLWHNAVFMPARVWQRVRPPGGDRTERVFLPGYLEISLRAGGALHVVAATEDHLFRALAAEERLGATPGKSLAECIAALEADERERLDVWSRAGAGGGTETAGQAAESRGERFDGTDPEWRARLEALVTLFDRGLARRDGRLALHPELPATTLPGARSLRAVAGLVTLRAFGDAREVLGAYLGHASEGRVPERFLADGTAVYDGAEPALWLVIMAERWARRSDETEFVKSTLYPALEEQLRFFRSGTPEVRAGEDGLLVTGTGAAATRRADLNALWYHADVAMAQLARTAGRRESAAFHLAWARDQQQRFVERFWDARRGCLFAEIGEEGPRPGLAPSQLWSVALSPPLLPDAQAARLLKTIERRLVTPFGLREAPRARVARPEWLGPLVSAMLRVRGRDDASLAAARARLEPLLAAAAAHGYAILPAAIEIPTGAEPAFTPAPGAAPLSTLAAAELLRAWVEHLGPAGAEPPAAPGGELAAASGAAARARR